MKEFSNFRLKVLQFFRTVSFFQFCFVVEWFRFDFVLFYTSKRFAWFLYIFLRLLNNWTYLGLNILIFFLSNVNVICAKINRLYFFSFSLKKNLNRQLFWSIWENYFWKHNNRSQLNGKSINSISVLNNFEIFFAQR